VGGEEASQSLAFASLLMRRLKQVEKLLEAE